MNKFLKKFLSISLCVVMLALMIPVVSLPTKALTSSSFISDATRREYIDMMMEYYISSNANLQTALSNGKSVVFMFEGGSDNAASHAYSESSSNVRDQAVCIVVKQVNGSNQIVFYNENSSSLPSQPSYTSGGDNDGQTTILDGIYSIKTWNHQGKYGALQVNVNKGLYTPSSNRNGVIKAASGINIHTRTSSTTGAPASAWSWGCQLIGYGNSSGNAFNEFMKIVAGINYNVWTTYSSNLATITTGKDVGYYVLDRQLAVSAMSESGIYNSAAISTLTASSAAAKERALASLHPNVNFNTIDDFSGETAYTSGATDYDWGFSRYSNGDILITTGKTTFAVANSIGNAQLTGKSFENSTYFGINLVNKHSGSIFLNFEPVNGSGQQLYVSLPLSGSNPIWLKDTAGNYSKASVSDVLSGTGRAVIGIPQGFNGTLMIPKAAMATSWNATTAADASSLQSLGFFVNGESCVTAGVDLVLITDFLADNGATVGPSAPDVTLTLVDDFTTESFTCGNASMQFGWARPVDGDILCSSSNLGAGNAITSVNGFGTSFLSSKNFSSVDYFAFEIENKNPGELFFHFEPLLPDASTFAYMSIELAKNNPVWLKNSAGVYAAANMTDAISWSGRAVVAIPQGFSGTILIPKAIMSSAFNGTTAIDCSKLNSFGFFMVGNGDGVTSIDYLKIKSFSTGTLTGGGSTGDDNTPTPTPTRITLTYDANGGSNAPSKKTVVAGQDFTLSKASPKRTGYTFLGWSQSASATTADFQPGGSISIDTDSTLYAVWQKNASTETEPPVDETEPPVSETEPPVNETEPPVNETEPPVNETEPTTDEFETDDDGNIEPETDVVNDDGEDDLLAPVKKGCGSAVISSAALIALIGAGMAIVCKKKED